MKTSKYCPVDLSSLINNLTNNKIGKCLLCYLLKNYIIYSVINIHYATLQLK